MIKQDLKSQTKILKTSCTSQQLKDYISLVDEMHPGISFFSFLEKLNEEEEVKQ
jgi:hypothetical protein